MLGANKWSVFIRVSKHCFFFEVIPVQVLSLVQSSTFASGVELSKKTSLESKPITSRVFHCSIFISSKPNSLKEDETAAPILVQSPSLPTKDGQRWSVVNLHYRLS